MKDTFTSDYNSDKETIDHFVVIINEQGNVRKGNVVQFIPSTGQNIEELPYNTFHKIFNHQSPDYNGKFSFINIRDRVVFEVTYENKRPVSYGNVEARESATSAPTGRSNRCIDWYLITTYYYEDGTYYTTEQYLFTTCDECQTYRTANGRSYRTNCGGGSGGNGETPIPVTKAVNWIVGAAADGAWNVKSYETLSGEKVVNNPSAGYFTGIVHNNSAIFNSVPNEPGHPYGTWQELQANVWLQTNVLARCTISGKVTYANNLPDTELNDRMNVWAFWTEFP